MCGLYKNWGGIEMRKFSLKSRNWRGSFVMPGWTSWRRFDAKLRCTIEIGKGSSIISRENIEVVCICSQGNFVAANRCNKITFIQNRTMIVYLPSFRGWWHSLFWANDKTVRLVSWERAEGSDSNPLLSRYISRILTQLGLISISSRVKWCRKMVNQL